MGEFLKLFKFFFDEKYVFSEFWVRQQIRRLILHKSLFDTKFLSHHRFRLQIIEKHLFFRMLKNGMGRTVPPSRDIKKRTSDSWSGTKVTP